MATLPQPRHLLASLISSLQPHSAEPTPAATSNPLQTTSPETQKALLTLHVLFPNELLPALDLLDRGFVTRFVLSMNSDARKETAVYYVRSAQQQARQYRSMASQLTSYEVRLNSWSCSCPAFAFSAFPADPSASTRTGVNTLFEDGSTGWAFGGLTKGNDTPVCKHILACVLVERSSIFNDLATEQEVSVEELAGWAAGWGD